MIRLNIRYFASFAEAAGTDAETVTTPSNDARVLFETLRERHGFRQTINHVRLAVNDRFRNWDEPLEEGDQIVFIPPVSGG